MNTHYYWWNSRIKEEWHANTLVMKIEESNYYFTNEPDIPTFFQYRKNTNQLYESIIDLAFCSDDMFDKTTN